ncbi:MAG TPA: lipoyl(octanoyl) transferase LipB [Dehalococcoidia bacterium]|nr:lipoyl(octanoyl) transferase LipB [Dehalococcoidia bacterium]
MTRYVVLRPGRMEYAAAWELQRRAADDVRAGGPERLILLEHPPTYTLGARARAEHLLAPEASLRALGAQVFRVDRGGDVTYHGPGQLVGYPILDLRRRGLGPVAYVRMLEETIMAALESYGVAAERRDGYPGVWVDGAKIAAIGVRIARGVSMHGFALNVNTDLSFFERIVPCGLPDVTVTSLQALLGRTVDLDDAADRVVASFHRRFGEARQPEPAAPAAVGGDRT